MKYRFDMFGNEFYVCAVAPWSMYVLIKKYENLWTLYCTKVDMEKLKTTPKSIESE
jgi:hypothetical protein